MGDRKSELVDEITQLLRQYRQEVPGDRKPWPDSIKKRVLELRQLGLPAAEVARHTGISYYTVWSWRQKKRSGFEPVSIVPARSAATVTVPKAPSKNVRGKKSRPPKAARKLSSLTVTVTIPGGVRIEGVSIEFLRRILPSLTGGIR